MQYGIQSIKWWCDVKKEYNFKKSLWLRSFLIIKISNFRQNSSVLTFPPRPFTSQPVATGGWQNEKTATTISRRLIGLFRRTTASSGLQLRWEVNQLSKPELWIIPTTSRDLTSFLLLQHPPLLDLRVDREQEGEKSIWVRLPLPGRGPLCFFAHGMAAASTAVVGFGRELWVIKLTTGLLCRFPLTRTMHGSRRRTIRRSEIPP